MLIYSSLIIHSPSWWCGRYPGCRPAWHLVFIGSWEVLIGAGLLFTPVSAARHALLLLWLQIAGTFQVFFLLPQAALLGKNPLLPAFFAYRLVLSGYFIPSGLMGVLGLAALVLYCALPAKESL